MSSPARPTQMAWPPASRKTRYGRWAGVARLRDGRTGIGPAGAATSLSVLASASASARSASAISAVQRRQALPGHRAPAEEPTVLMEVALHLCPRGEGWLQRDLHLARAVLGPLGESDGARSSGHLIERA